MNIAGICRECAGGTHSDDNVRPAHKVCNSRKGASWS